MAAEVGVTYPRRNYANPPIVEAIARVHLSQPIPWTVTTPGLLYARLRQNYSREPQMQNIMQTEVSPVAGADAANVEVKSGPPRLVFGTEDGDRLLIVGTSDVSSHGLAPYEGWESLEGRLFAAIGLIGDMLPEQRFTGLGVRYVNRVVIPRVEFKFEEYLTVGFAMPPGFPPSVNAFFDRAECLYPDGMSRIAFTWATTEAEEGTAAFILDLDLNWQSEEPLTPEQARAEIGALKAKETAAFESLLRDEIRELFGEIR